MTSLPATHASPALAAWPVRKIQTADLDWALAEGWKDFLAKRGDLVVVAVLYPLIGLISAALVLNEALLPMFFPLVTGLSLMGPAVASGFYELASRRELGLSSSWFHFFDPLRGRSRGGLIGLTAILLAIFVAWQVAAGVIYETTLGGVRNLGLADFTTRIFTTPEGWTMMFLGNLVGFAFAILTLVITVVAFPMVVDKPVSAGAAVSTSLRAVRANPGVIANWGLRVAVLLLLGCLPAFIGLAVVLPLLGYATWHLYTRLVER